MKKLVLPAALTGASIPLRFKTAHADTGFMGLNLYGSLSGGLTMTRNSRVGTIAG